MIISLYGLTIRCQTDSPDLAVQLLRPFSCFKNEASLPAITVIVKQEKPPYETFPDAEARFSTPRNIVYKSRDCKIIDYFGNGAIVEYANKSIFYLYGLEKNFLMEAFYLLVLSLFGQFCDRQGLLRIHALGVSYKEKAFLFLVPPGGGKSTMALAMLRESNFKLISDDEIIVDRDGSILPFPLRIGVLDKGRIGHIPNGYIYTIDRMEFGPKSFVDLSYWANQIETKHLTRANLFSIRMVLHGKQVLHRISKTKILSILIRDAVVGIGLFQGVEFVFNNSAWEICTRVPVALRRLRAAIKLAFRSKSYEFVITRDVEANIRLLKEYIKNLS